MHGELSGQAMHQLGSLIKLSQGARREASNLCTLFKADFGKIM